MSEGRQRFLSRFRRGALDAFLLRAGGLGLLFLMHMVFGRFVGAEDYGTLTYTLALGALLAKLTSLGWPTALLRLIAQYTESERWGLLRGAAVRANQVVLGASFLASLALWGIAEWLPAPGELSVILKFSALLLPLLASVELRRKSLQALHCIQASIIPEEIVLPLLTIAASLFFAVSTASEALTGYLGSAVAVFCLGNVWLWRSFPQEGKVAPAEFRTRKWMAIALPMVLGSISQLAMNRVDVLMLGAMLNMEAAGLYGAASRVATLNTFVLRSVNTVAAPMLASSYHARQMGHFRSITRKGMAWSALGALPLLIVMLVRPQFPLSFFGGEFVRGLWLLRILACGQFLNAAAGPVGFVLLVSGREKQYAVSTTAVACANALGNLLLIPKYGAVGACCVTALSVIVLNGWQLALARQVWAKS